MLSAITIGWQTWVGSFICYLLANLCAFAIVWPFVLWTLSKKMAEREAGRKAPELGPIRILGQEEEASSYRRAEPGEITGAPRRSPDEAAWNRSSPSREEGSPVRETPSPKVASLDPQEEISQVYNRNRGQSGSLQRSLHEKQFEIHFLSVEAHGTDLRFATVGAPDAEYWLLRRKNVASADAHNPSSGFVVPNPSIEFAAIHYDRQRMREVFDCRNYKPGYRYGKLTLVRAARFKRDDGIWRATERGEIQLEEPAKELV